MKSSPSPATAEIVRKEVHAYVLANFLPGESGEDLRDDDLLFESGIVDSVGAMSLISFLGQRFKIVIADADLYPENFESVGRITSFVVKRLNHRQL